MTSKNDIRNYIKNEILKNDTANIGDITDNLNLIELNIIDSLQILKLVSFLESENNISIDIDDLDFDTFQSIEAIYEFIESKVKS